MKEKIMSSRFVRWLSTRKLIVALSEHRIFGKFVNYEFITYIIAGVLTTLLNYAVYFLVRLAFPGDFGTVIANAVAWTAAVLFAFVVNKIFVFDSPSWDRKTLLREFFPFIAARLLSLGFDMLFVYVTVELLHWNEPLMKILSNVFVLLMNYIASKFIIFKKKKEADDGRLPEENASGQEPKEDDSCLS